MLSSDHFNLCPSSAHGFLSTDILYAATVRRLLCSIGSIFLNVKAFYLKCPKCPHSIVHPVGQSPHYCAVIAILVFLLSLGHIAESHFSHMQNLDYSGYFLRGSHRCRCQHLSVAPAAAIGHCLAEVSLLFLSQMEV